MTALNPYLNFDGNCEEAFEFYKSVFGGEYGDVNRFSEMPGDEISPADANKILHISLPVGESQLLMGSDRIEGMPSTNFGDSITVSVGPNSAEEGSRIFEALSEGGTVTMPYERQFWGADYGSCVDRFGINWMVNYAPAD